MTIYDVKVRFERKVAPKDYEHALGEVQFSASGEFESLEDANKQALALMAASKNTVLSALGAKNAPALPDTAETTVTAAPADGKKNKGGRPAGSTNKPKEEPKAADKPAAGADEFGEGEASTKGTDPEFADAGADEFADAADEPKAMEAKELQSWISGHIQGKRIAAAKVREIMMSFKVARTDDTTAEQRPKIVKAIETAMKAEKK